MASESESENIISNNTYSSTYNSYWDDIDNYTNSSFNNENIYDWNIYNTFSDNINKLNNTTTITTNSTNNGIVAESTKLLFLIGVFFGLVFLAVFIVLMKKRRNRNRNRNLNNGIINQNYEEKLNPNNLNNDNPPTRRSIFDAVYEEPTTFNENYQSQNPIYEESF